MQYGKIGEVFKDVEINIIQGVSVNNYNILRACFLADFKAGSSY